MRYRLYLAAVGAATLSTGSIAVAQTFDCCAAPSAPTVIYGTPPVPIVVPPTGYVLDPSDARKPIYVVNQGPVYSGPNIYAVPLYTGAVGLYAVPTYSEGGYAYAQPYPYVKSYWAHWRWRRPYAHRRYWDPSYRPYGYPPYGAYRYRPAPGARVIQVPEQFEWTSLSR